MENIVVDASVVIKWYKSKNEKNIIEARAYLGKLLKDEITIGIPDLLFYEIINVIAFDRTVSFEKWQKVLENLFALPFTLYPIDKVLTKEILLLSRERRLTAYDASYLALAKRLKAKVLTEDEELLIKAPDLTRNL